MRLLEPPFTRWPRLVLDWLCGGRDDYREFRERKASETYRVRRSWCGYVWIGAGGLMLLYPAMPFVVSAALVATFLSLMILDAE